MSLPIPAGTYAIDAAHTQLSFSVRHLGISTVSGRFDTFSGELVVGPELTDTAVSLDAEMASVNTGNAMRDGHLQGADFFAVAEHPKLTFRSSSIGQAGDGYHLAGELTVKGVTQPVVLDVSFNGTATHPADQKARFGFQAKGSISRSAFGVSYGAPMVSDEVVLQLDAQFVAPAA